MSQNRRARPPARRAEAYERAAREPPTGGLAPEIIEPIGRWEAVRDQLPEHARRDERVSAP